MNAHPAYACGTIVLQQLINRMVASLRINLTDTNTIVNEIPAELAIAAEKGASCAIMEDLLRAVFFNARNGDIHISAEKFAGAVLFRIEDRNNYNGYALAARLQGIEPEARKLGGDVYIKGQQQLVTTVSFCFPDIA